MWDLLFGYGYLGGAPSCDEMRRQQELSNAMAWQQSHLARFDYVRALQPAAMNRNCDGCGAPLKYDGFHDCRYCGRTK